MDTLRRRKPFKLLDEDGEEDENLILDEQQQEALIELLRNENETVNRRYAVALRCVLGLSFVLQLLAFRRNPLLAIFPNQRSDPSIPLPVVFTVLSLLIHLNFVLFFNSDGIRFFTSDEIRTGLQLSDSLTPLSSQLLYPLSAVAPTLSLVLGKPWQTTAWWLITPAVIFVVQIVIEAIQQSVHGIDHLENMKYTAPGA